MPGQTPHGFRYPNDSDPVGDIASTTRNLANDVDDRVGAISCGLVSATVSNAATGTATVTFPAGRFLNTPRIVATCASTSVYNAYISAVDINGATITVRRFDGAVSTASVPVNWIAVDQS